MFNAPVPRPYEAPPATIPLVANFTALNAGSATFTNTPYGIAIVSDNDGEYHGMHQAAPATPYNVYMRTQALCLSNNADTDSIHYMPGILLRDGPNGDFLAAGLVSLRSAAVPTISHYLRLDRWTNETTPASAPLVLYSMSPMNWIRVAVSSTQVDVYASLDGVTWLLGGSELLADHVGAITQIGFGLRSGANNDTTLAMIQQFGTVAPV